MLNEARNEVILQEEYNDTSQTAATSEDVLDFADSFETFLEQIVPAKSTSRRAHSSASSEASSDRHNFFRRTSAHTQPTSSSSSNSSISMSGQPRSRFPIQPISPTDVLVRQTTHARHNECPVQPQNDLRPQPNDTGRVDIHTSFEVSRQANRADVSPPGPLRLNRVPRGETIGRHAISLSTNYFRLNEHSLKVNNYVVANRFYDDLLLHRDRLDELDVILSLQGDDREWFVIPGWRIHLGRVTLLAKALGIRDV